VKRPARPEPAGADERDARKEQEDIFRRTIEQHVSKP